MKSLCFLYATLYLGFFGVIGIAIYITGSAWPLLAIVLMPSFDISEKEGG